MLANVLHKSLDDRDSKKSHQMSQWWEFSASLWAECITSMMLPAQSQTRNSSRQSDTNHSGGGGGGVRGGPIPTRPFLFWPTTISAISDDDLPDDPPVLGAGRGVSVGLAG